MNEKSENFMIASLEATLFKNSDRPSDPLRGVKYRATSLAKK